MGDHRGAYRAATSLVGGRFRHSMNDGGRLITVGDFRGRSALPGLAARFYSTVDSHDLAVKKGHLTPKGERCEHTK